MRETFKHLVKPSEFNLRVICVVRSFALSNFSGTVVTKYMVCLFVVTAPETSGTKQAD